MHTPFLFIPCALATNHITHIIFSADSYTDCSYCCRFFSRFVNRSLCEQFKIVWSPGKKANWYCYCFVTKTGNKKINTRIHKKNVVAKKGNQRGERGDCVPSPWWKMGNSSMCIYAGNRIHEVLLLCLVKVSETAFWIPCTHSSANFATQKRIECSTKSLFSHLSSFVGRAFRPVVMPFFNISLLTYDCHCNCAHFKCEKLKETHIPANFSKWLIVCVAQNTLGSISCAQNVLSWAHACCCSLLYLSTSSHI